MVSQLLTSMNTFLLQCKRVWVSLRKPTAKEFETISKVSAIGILIIGLLGFLVSMVVVPFFRSA